jgi:hypothetical protein
MDKAADQTGRLTGQIVTSHNVQSGPLLWAKPAVLGVGTPRWNPCEIREICKPAYARKRALSLPFFFSFCSTVIRRAGTVAVPACTMTHMSVAPLVADMCLSERKPLHVCLILNQDTHSWCLGVLQYLSQGHWPIFAIAHCTRSCLTLFTLCWSQFGLCASAACICTLTLLSFSYTSCKHIHIDVCQFIISEIHARAPLVLPPPRHSCLSRATNPAFNTVAAI